MKSGASVARQRTRPVRLRCVTEMADVHAAVRMMIECFRAMAGGLANASRIAVRGRSEGYGMMGIGLRTRVEYGERGGS